METLITINSIDIKEVRINTESPKTIRKTQVSKDVIEKFLKFEGTRRASINIDVLKRVKPEINEGELDEYEENLSLDQIFKRLGKSNAILVDKYGYKNLNVSPESFEKAVNESLDEPLKIIEEQKKEIEELKEENKRLKNNNEKIENVYPEYNDIGDDFLPFDDIN